MATINNTMGANLLIPKNVEDPDFRQTVSSESGVQLTSVIIDNHKTWRLAAPQDLLLPGQGYMLVVVPVLSSNTEGGKK